MMHINGVFSQTHASLCWGSAVGVSHLFLLDDFQTFCRLIGVWHGLLLAVEANTTSHRGSWRLLGSAVTTSVYISPSFTGLSFRKSTPYTQTPGEKKKKITHTHACEQQKIMSLLRLPKYSLSALCVFQELINIFHSHWRLKTEISILQANNNNTLTTGLV